jgi:hypothetical protein
LQRLSALQQRVPPVPGIAGQVGNRRPYGEIELFAMANGTKGDHPLMDILSWKIGRFSPAVDALILAGCGKKQIPL